MCKTGGQETKTYMNTKRFTTRAHEVDNLQFRPQQISLRKCHCGKNHTCTSQVAWNLTNDFTRTSPNTSSQLEDYALAATFGRILWHQSISTLRNYFLRRNTLASFHITTACFENLEDWKMSPSSHQTLIATTFSSQNSGLHKSEIGEILVTALDRNAQK